MRILSPVVKGMTLLVGVMMMTISMGVREMII